MKSVSILTAILLISIPSLAQKFIPKLGVTFSRISVDDRSGQTPVGGHLEMKTRLGYTLGFALQFPLNQNLSLQPEIIYVQKGARAEDSKRHERAFDDTGIVYWEDKHDLKLSYLEVPLILKCSFGKKQRFFVYGGPSLAIGLGGSISYYNATGYQNGGLWEERRNGKVFFMGQPWEAGYDDVRMDHLLDFGLNIGSCATIGPILIDVRYTAGLRNVFESASSQGNNSRNKAIQFTIGYPLKLTPKS